MTTTASSGPDRCPDCKYPTDSDEHFACISKHFEEDDTMTSAVPSPPVPVPAATPTAAGTGQIKTGFIERLVTAIADGAAKRIEAKAAADVAKLEAKARLTQPKPAAAKAPAPGSESNKSAAQMKGLPWPVIAILIPLGAVFWAIFFSAATFGQGMMLSHPKTTAMLAQHVEWTLDLTTGMIIGGVIEFAAVFFLFLSIARRIANDGGAGSKIVSNCFAVISISINVFGHAWIGDTLGMVIFGFFSVTAFLGLAQVSDFAVRQILRKRGILDHRPPSLGFRFARKNPDLVLRYHAAFIANPELGKQGALEAARAERKKEEQEMRRAERAAALAKALRRTADKKHSDPIMADIWYLRHDPPLMADLLIARTDNEAAVDALDAEMREDESRLAAEKLDAKVTEFVERNTPTPTPNRASNGQESTPNKPGGFFRKTGRKVGNALGIGTPTDADESDPTPVGNEPDTAPNRMSRNDADTPVDKRPKERRTISAEQDRTVVMSVINSDREQVEKAVMAWLLPLLAKGEKVTNAEIERRLGFNPEVSKGTNGKRFREKAEKQLEEIKQQEGATL